jgi:hypothetical protein
MEGLDTGSTTPKTPRQHSPSLSVNPTPCDIDFRGLGFSIATKDGSRLPILQNVTGSCRSCRLVRAHLCAAYGQDLAPGQGAGARLHPASSRPLLV